MYVIYFLLLSSVRGFCSPLKVSVSQSVTCTGVSVCFRRHDNDTHRYTTSRRRLARRSGHIQIKLLQLAKQREFSAAAGWNTLPCQRVHWPTPPWQAVPRDVIRSGHPPAWRHQKETKQRLGRSLEEPPFWWRQHVCYIARPRPL